MIKRFISRNDFEGKNKTPSTLHKYIHTSVDPVNKFDPSGYMGLGDVMTWLNIQLNLNLFNTA